MSKFIPKPYKKEPITISDEFRQNRANRSSICGIQPEPQRFYLSMY